MPAPYAQGVATTSDTAAPGQLYDQPSAAPSPKVTAVGVGGAASLVLIWVYGAVQANVPALPQMTPEIAGAICVLAATGAGYLKRDRAPA